MFQWIRSYLRFWRLYRSTRSCCCWLSNWENRFLSFNHGPDLSFDRRGRRKLGTHAGYTHPVWRRIRGRGICPHNTRLIFHQFFNIKTKLQGQNQHDNKLALVCFQGDLEKITVPQEWMKNEPVLSVDICRCLRRLSWISSLILSSSFKLSA